MRVAVKGLVFVLLLMLGLGARSALACVEDGSRANAARTMVVPNGPPPAIEFDRVASERRCDCPAPTEEAHAAVTQPEKSLVMAPTERSGNLLHRSSCELLGGCNALGKSLFEASPASALAAYLLTARLRC